MNARAGNRWVAGRLFAPLVVMLALVGCGNTPLDATSFDPTDLQRDLVAHWTFDEGMGTTVGDRSGNGHDGVLMGGNWISSGRFGGALELASGNYVSVANFPQATESWTVSVWTRSSPDALAKSTNDLSTLISTEIVFKGGWQVHLDNRPNYQRFDAAYWAGSTYSDYVVVFCACIEPDRWIHLTTVWDSARARMTLYRDEYFSNDSPLPGPILTGDTTLYMGTWGGSASGSADGTGTAPGTDRFLTGDIDDFAIWRRALDLPEIAALTRHSPTP